MRRFYLDRKVDATGISGTGCIAQGVQFSDGTCVIRWITKHRSTAVYESIETLETIHGHGGATVIRWHDPLCFVCGTPADRDQTGCLACGSSWDWGNALFASKPEPSSGKWVHVATLAPSE